MLYKIGIRELDNLMNETFTLPSLLVIAGHPGSGKTTLATKICLANAEEGRICTYVTLQEDKEKLFTTMTRLGLNLEKAEKKGYYHFIRLPIIESSLSTTLDVLNKLIIKNSPRIVIIDSINALFSNFENNKTNLRTLIQNYFYNLPKLINGLVILITEVPFHSENIPLGHLDFVADTILFLKNKTVKGRLVRILEIRKARGANITEIEIPFAISHSKGIQLFTSPILERIQERGGKLKLPCKELENTIVSLRLGNYVYLHFPADEHPVESFMLMLALAVYNNKKLQIISYKYSSETLNLLLWKGVKYSSLLYEKTKNVQINKQKLFNEFKNLIRNTVLVGLNPFSYSLQELFIKELELAEDNKADIVMFHGSDLLEATYTPEDYIPLIYNHTHLLKSKGKLIIRANADYIKIYKDVHSTISDIIISWNSESCSHKTQKTCRKIIIRSHNGKHVIDLFEIWKCITLGLESLFNKSLS